MTNEIEKINDTMYLVSSATSPNEPHMVFKNRTIIDNVWRCDCIGYSYRQGCSHVKRVMEIIGDKI